MNWIAYMRDGSAVKEIDEFPFNKLDFDNVDRFRISESGNNTAVPFSADSGIIRFTNLDLAKVRNLSNEKLVFEFDKQNGLFKLDKESLALMRDLVIKDESLYYFIEFDQTGMFNINGERLYTGFELNKNERIEFKNQPPYHKIIQYKNGYSEMRMRGNKPLIKNDKTINYIIGYKKTHTYKDIEFKLKYEVVYDLINRYVMLDFIMQANKSIPGKIFLSYGGKESYIPIQLTANSPMQTKRILTVI